MPDGLPPEDAGCEDAVHVVDPGLLRPDAAPRPPERPAVVGLGRRGDVEALHERAVVDLLAPVADVGGRPDPETGPLPELVAALEAPREVLVELLLGSPATRPPTGVEVLADAARASVAPVAGDAPCEDLPRDGRFGASHLMRDLRDRPPEAEQELDPLPFVNAHVLCHGLAPFSVPRPCRRHASSNFAGVRVVYRQIPDFAEVNASDPSGRVLEGERASCCPIP